MKWSIGITTVPSRDDAELPQTYASLRTAGFTIDRLFVDGETNVDIPVPQTLRTPNIGVTGNWILGIYELFLRDRFADRYAMFQDDVVCCRNLLSFLETQELPENSWWNLSSHDQCEHTAKKQKVTGWYNGHNRGCGALAVIFPNAAVRELLSSKAFVHFLTDPHAPDRYPKYIDKGIFDSLNDAGFTEYYHYPALIQHIGHQSTVRPGKRWQGPLFKSFPGEDFDALCLNQTTEHSGTSLTNSNA